MADDRKEKRAKRKIRTTQVPPIKKRPEARQARR